MSVSHPPYALEGTKSLRANRMELPPASDTSRDTKRSTPQGVIVLIEKRTLIRDSLTESLTQQCATRVISYPTIERWAEAGLDEPVSLIILSISRKLSDVSSEEDISALSQLTNGVPVAVLSDAEDLDEIVEALDHGARGYIPSSLSLKVAIEAIRLVSAGGVFVPASSLMAAKRAPDESANSQRYFNGIFTARQAAVVEALRRGKANKIIAYELNMRESTVKVHVRTIMKKLKAKNRTEVAFLANGFLNGDLQLSG